MNTEGPEYHYSTVSEAMEALRSKGYTADFILRGDALYSGDKAIGAQECTVREVYRYEGNTDPADEAVVYAIETDPGVKGILVTAYGAYTDPLSGDFLRNLHRDGRT